MSKLSDYSKFDHLVDSDDDDEQDAAAPVTTATAAAQPKSSTPVSAAQPAQPQHTKDPKTGRYVFTYGTQKVYEWEQSLDSVTLYIDAPPGQTAKSFVVEITTKHLKVGLKDHDRFFLEEGFYSLVDTTESCWYLEDDVLQIVLAKQHRGETWTCVLKGGETNPAVQEELQQQLLLERFQEENPGMDFRGATFSGSAPDPRTYMGGIGYK